VSVAAGRARLANAMRQLQSAWLKARADWDDPVARSIEQRQLADIERAVASALRAMDGMHEVLARVRKDCGEDEAGR
jgi:hypothetical protein